MSNRKKIYLASPLFNPMEREFNERLTKILERSCDVYLPQRDGQLVAELRKQPFISSAKIYRIVFNADMHAIRQCDALLINLNGRTIDEGSAFELGAAHVLGKICVGYKDDERILISTGLNPMIQVPLVTIVKSLDNLAKWVGSYAAGTSPNQT